MKPDSKSFDLRFENFAKFKVKVDFLFCTLKLLSLTYCIVKYVIQVSKFSRYRQKTLNPFEKSFIITRTAVFGWMLALILPLSYHLKY